MFSGIYSAIFGKKGHKEDKSHTSTGNDNDFVILERRHSDEYHKNSDLYPDLDPPSNLPYAISPSLPNVAIETKEDVKVDMLQGVSFELSTLLNLLCKINDEDFAVHQSAIDNLEKFSEEYNYDFELEHSVLSEFSES